MADNDTKVNVDIGASGSYKSVVSQASSDFDNLWKKIGLGKTAGLLAASGIAAAGAAAVEAVKQASAFQSEITQLATGAGESQKNLKLVGDGIKSIAINTGTTLKSLTDGMFMIESAGYHGKSGLDVLNIAAEGAKVGNADLGTSAQALTTVMHDYSIAANNSGQAMNFIVSTVANGKMHMQDLVSSLGSILPTASQLHIPLAQVGGAMSTMTVAGISADRAATALRFTMSNLAAPSTAAQKAMDSVGLSSGAVSDTLTHHGLIEAMQQITDAIGKKFPAGSAGYFTALKDITGGTRGLQGALATTGTNMQTFIDNSKKISDATEKAGNKVQGWNLIQQDFSQKVAAWKERVQVAFVDLGQRIIPILLNFIQGFQNISDKLIKFLKPSFEALWHTLTDSVIPALTKLWHNIIEPFLPVIGALFAAAWWVTINAINVFMQVISPVISFIAGHKQIVIDFALAFGTLALYMKFDAIRSAFIGNMNAVMATIGGVKQSVVDLFTKISGGTVMGGIAVAGALADIALVAQAVQSVLGAINAMNQAKAAAAADQRSNQAAIAQMQALANHGTPAQKARAIKALSQLAPGLGYATGTEFAPGGLALVGEEGPELIDLPRGSRVFNNSQTNQIINNKTANSQAITVHNLTIQASNNSTFQTIMKSINQDTLNASKGLTVGGGAI